MKRFHAFITGNVQGVGFRNFTTINAKKLGIKGSVKNLDDGRVEVIAEAEQDKLKEFLNIIKKGPNTARVTDIEINWEKPQGHTNFKREY